MRNIRVFIEFAPMILCLVIGLVIGLSFAFTSLGSHGAVAAAPKPAPQIANVTHNITPTPTGAWAHDPLIGGWRYGFTTGYSDIYLFNADGTYIENFYNINTGKTDVFAGTWRPQGNNSYVTVNAATNDAKILIYSPIENGILSPDHPSILLTPYYGSVIAPPPLR